MSETSFLDDPLLTPQQVGALLGLSVATLANKRALHGPAWLPYLKLNERDCRYRRSVVLAFIAEREASTPQTIRAAAERRLNASAKAAA